MKIDAILRIAKWEFLTQFSTLNRRTLLVLIVIGIIIGGVVAIGQDRKSIEEDIYIIGIDSDVPERYSTALKMYHSTKPVESSKPSLYDVYITEKNGELIAKTKDTERAKAAASEVNLAIDKYNDRIMRFEENKSAAFPVSVQITYISQFSSDSTQTQQLNGDNGDSVENNTTVNEESRSNSQTGSTPDDISPPFPLKSLVLAFTFIIPMNFIVQSFSSSIMQERRNNRGELLLSAPISRFDIIAGKTIPYISTLVIITLLISLLIGSGFLSFFAVLPVAVMYLGVGFVIALVSRSYKELSFLILLSSVFLTSFVFVPAIFTDIHPISSISPLTIVIAGLRDESVTLFQFLFSTTPLLFTGGLLFAFGSGLYRQEDLFNNRKLRYKLYDLIAYQIRSKKSAFVLSAVSIPFVLIFELLLISIIFLVPPELSFIIIFAIAAVIEELAKAIHIYVGFKKDLYPNTIQTAVIVGFLSGMGFFVAEKVTVLAQTVGLLTIDAGKLAFLNALTPPAASTTGLLSILILLIWPFLHSITTICCSIITAKNNNKFFVGLIVATLIHILYNFSVVMLYG